MLHPTQTLSEPLNIRGVTVPKDTMVMVQILPVHRHPKFWTDPLKFDPDRWSVPCPRAHLRCPASWLSPYRAWA